MRMRVQGHVPLNGKVEEIFTPGSGEVSSPQKDTRVETVVAAIKNDWRRWLDFVWSVSIVGGNPFRIIIIGFELREGIDVFLR